MPGNQVASLPSVHWSGCHNTLAIQHALDSVLDVFNLVTHLESHPNFPTSVDRGCEVGASAIAIVGKTLIPWRLNGEPRSACLKTRPTCDAPNSAGAMSAQPKISGLDH